MFRLREQHCASRRHLSGEGTETAGARGALGSACRRERAEVPQMCKGSSIQSFVGSEAFFPAVCSPIWRLLSAWSGGAWGCRSLGLQPSPIRGSHPPHPLSYYRGLTSPCLSVLDKLRGSRPDRHSCGKGWGTGGHLQQQGQPDWLSPPTPVLLSLPLSQSRRTLGSSPQGHCVPSGVKKTLQK